MQLSFVLICMHKVFSVYANDILLVKYVYLMVNYIQKRNYMQMWPSLIAKAKQGGLDVIQTYVFWNLHEPQPDQVFLTSQTYTRMLVAFYQLIEHKCMY